MKKEPFIFIFAGDDDFALDESAKGLIKTLLKPDEEVFGLETIEGRAEKAEQAAEIVKKCKDALGTVAFLGGGRVVWLRNVNFFGKTAVGRTKETIAAVDGLAEFIKAGTPPGNKLIVTASSLDTAGSFHKACVGQGAQVQAGEAAKPYQLDARARDYAAKALSAAGLKMPNDVMSAFIEKTGSDARFITNEVDKLATYLGAGKTVTAEDIRAVTSGGREIPTWDLEDAVGYGNLPGALTALRQLLLQGEFPVALVMSLERRLNHLIVFRQALDRGWVAINGSGNWVQVEWSLPPEVEQAMPALGKDNPVTMNKWRAGKLAEQAKGMSMVRLRRGRELLIKAHESLVSQSAPPTVVMELLLVNLLGVSAVAAHAR